MSIASPIANTVTRAPVRVMIEETGRGGNTFNARIFGRARKLARFVGFRARDKETTLLANDIPPRGFPRQRAALALIGLRRDRRFSSHILTTLLLFLVSTYRP